LTDRRASSQEAPFHGPKLPNFFIVGTAKAGTTSLHRYLRQHPQVYMSPVKEPSYFADEIRPEYLSPAFARHIRRQPQKWPVLDWEEYQELFHAVENERAIGEATPSYLWAQTAARNIHSRIPDARIVMMLRDPAERAHSQYLHHLAEGFTRYTFRQQIDECRRSSDRLLSIIHPFLEFGLYYEQVNRYLELFPREQIRIYLYEEAWRSPGFFADLFRFLDVDTGFRPDTSHKALERRAPRLVAARYFLTRYEMWPRLKAFVPQAFKPGLRRLAFRHGAGLAMDPTDRQYLIGYYREDIGKLASLLDRDLSAWLR